MPFVPGPSRGSPPMVRPAPISTLSISTADLPILGPPANASGQPDFSVGFPDRKRSVSAAAKASIRCPGHPAFPQGHGREIPAPMTIPPTTSSLQLPRISWGFPRLQRPVWVFDGADAPVPVIIQANMSAPGNRANSRTPQLGDSGLNSLTSKAAKRYPKQEGQQPATPAIELQMTF